MLPPSTLGCLCFLSCPFEQTPAVPALSPGHAASPALPDPGIPCRGPSPSSHHVHRHWYECITPRAPPQAIRETFGAQRDARFKHPSCGTASFIQHLRSSTATRSKRREKEKPRVLRALEPTCSVQRGAGTKRGNPARCHLPLMPPCPGAGGSQRG